MTKMTGKEVGDGPFLERQILLCCPEFSPQMVGTSELAASDPLTLKASTEQSPPANIAVPVGPAIVNVSKSSLRKQMSVKEI